MKAGIVLAAGCWLLVPGVQAQDAATLLSQMKQAETTVAYSATQSGNGGTARVFRSGLKRRMEWLSPDVRRGDVLVDDGQHVTLFHRADGSATQTNSRTRAANFSASGAASRTELSGRPAFSVPVGPRRTLVIDAQTKVLLAVRGGQGGFALSNIRFVPVASSKFSFSPPPGVKVQKFDGALYANLNGAKRAARWLAVPDSLPGGWSFERGIVGQSSAWLRFSNGQNRISLFQQPTKDADLPPQKVDGGMFWRKSGVRFLATGSPQSALDQVIDSLK